MRFTSLIVELVRARPRLIFWIAVLAQAALWFILPVLLYGSPPGDMATILAFGREHQVGTQLGPPAAFWLADLAFRLSGNHIFSVYLLSQLCFVVTFWALFQLGRAIVGGQQATEGHGPNPAVIPWLNLDVPGLECRSHGGFSFQATLGLTMPLADFHYDVADVGDTVHAGEILPQGRFGFGWWF